VLESRGETYLMVIAEKLRADARIHDMPQQSDYENALWQGQALEAWSRRMAVLNRIKHRVPVPLMNIAIPLRSRVKDTLAQPFQDPSIRRIDPCRMPDRR
jgi:hypothetical protein